MDALAAASEDEVLKCWQGLGYYSRARNLHAAARQIVEWGGFPERYENIRQLKGVGDYTAAAIASFAFGLPHAVVDGNVYRVLSRYYGIEEPIDTGHGKKYFAAMAQELLPEGKEAADYNQAVMDFGAMQCVPKSPKCEDCPLVDGRFPGQENTGISGKIPCSDRDRTLFTLYVYRGGGRGCSVPAGKQRYMERFV